ncbi:TetR/AcrR family transcriptional regulator [Alicyclobacillus curvatus]|jgi:AcrR family transcriptional regulator|nr:TetR/AcrR family transcriptional regulator [Alicyclobacillus curvatus]
MRHKDENKRDAIFRATIELLNQIGFSDISMSKIAKHAKVSSATIYVYFENKDDMLRKVYLHVKEKMSRQMTSHVNGSMSICDAHRQIMTDLLHFVRNNRDEFLFMEQFTASPMLDRLLLQESSELAIQTLHDFIDRGKRENELKPYDAKLLLSYCYFPIARLATAEIRHRIEITARDMDAVIQMSWDAIRA